LKQFISGPTRDIDKVTDAKATARSEQIIIAMKKLDDAKENLFLV